MNKELDCFPICLLMRKNSMARVNVRVDCSPFGFGLHTSLAGIEDMMTKGLFGIPVKSTSLIASLEHVRWSHCSVKLFVADIAVLCYWFNCIPHRLLNAVSSQKMSHKNQFLLRSSPGFCSIKLFMIVPHTVHSKTSSQKAVLTVCSFAPTKVLPLGVWNPVRDVWSERSSDEKVGRLLPLRKKCWLSWHERRFKEKKSKWFFRERCW